MKDLMRQQTCSIFRCFLWINFFFVFLCNGQQTEKTIALQKSIEELTKMIETESNYDNYFLRGTYYFTLGQLAEAQTDMNSCLEINPQAEEPLCYLGMIETKKKQFTKAIHYFNSFIEVKPNSYLGHLHRGYTYLQMNNWEKATTDIDFCLSLKPNDIDALTYKGILWSQQNKCKEAIVLFDKVLAQEKHNETALENRAFCKASLGQNALSDFNQLCIIAPNNGQYFFNRAVYIINTKSKGNFCADLKKALSLGVTEAKEIIQNTCK